MDQLNDAKFVKRLIAGDEAAFATFFDVMAPRLSRYIGKLIGVEQSDAEELASDALFKIHNSVGTFDPNRGAKLTTWAHQIAHNTAVDHYRRSKNLKGKLPSELRVGSLPPNNDDRAAAYKQDFYAGDGDTEEEETINLAPSRRAFNTLSQEERDILLMRAVMTYEEIAGREGILAGAARTRHSRAMHKLLDAYEKEKTR